MLKEAIEKIASLAENKVYQIDGHTYSDNPLELIDSDDDRPECLTVSSLDSIARLLENEIEHVCAYAPVFVRVSGPTRVDVFTTLDGRCKRNSLYSARCAVPEFRDGWREHASAIIEIRSKFVPGEGADYLLRLLGSIVKNDSVASNDNGVSQSVTARTGVALAAKVQVDPRVELQPYRTFLEVEQPASEFLLRLDDQGRVGLFEADGGMWQLEAKNRVLQYLQDQLHGLCESGKVVVMQ